MRSRRRLHDLIGPALVSAAVLMASVRVAAHGDECAGSDDPWLDLSVAIQEPAPEVIDCLISIVGINNSDPTDIWENTPLHMAVQHDQKEVVELLIERGANVDLVNAADATPLRFAIRYDATRALEAILAHEPDLEFADYEGRTALFWAIAKDDAFLVSKLIGAGASVDHEFQISGMAPKSLVEYAKERAIPEIVTLIEQSR